MLQDTSYTQMIRVGLYRPVHVKTLRSQETADVADPSSKAGAYRLYGCVERIILTLMAALLSPLREGDIWRVRVVWPNRAVHYFGKFTSERDATDWINAHPRLTKPEDTMD
jgi:hypothetical protein